MIAAFVSDITEFTTPSLNLSSNPLIVCPLRARGFVTLIFPFALSAKGAVKISSLGTLTKERWLNFGLSKRAFLKIDF